MKANKQCGLIEITFVEPLVMTMTVSGLRLGIRGRANFPFCVEWLVSYDVKRGIVRFGKDWKCKFGGKSLILRNKKFFGDGFLFMRLDAVKEIRNRAGKRVFPFDI